MKYRNGGVGSFTPDSVHSQEIASVPNANSDAFNRETRRLQGLVNRMQPEVKRTVKRDPIRTETRRIFGINVQPKRTIKHANRTATEKKETLLRGVRRLYVQPKLTMEQTKQVNKEIQRLSAIDVPHRQTYKYLPLHTGRKTSPNKTHKKRVYSLPGNTQFVNQLKPLLDEYLPSYNVEYNSAECKKPTTSASKSVTAGITFKAQQRFVSDFISLHTPFTGIVLWHGLGSGKTLSAIAIGEKMISDVEMRQKIRMRKYNMMIVAPAMLEDNFRSELEKYDPYYKTHRPREPTRNEVLYHKFSANGKLQMSVSKTMAEFEENIVRSVIIIDESQLVIHLVTNAIMEGKKSALLSNYEKMLKEDTCRIVCLSGTPIVKWPVELAVLFNLLAKCPTVYKFQMNPSPSVISYSAFRTMFHKKHQHTLECIDYARTYVDTATGLLCIVRNPLYFISTADGIVYDEHKNSYDNSKFTEDLIKMLGPMAGDKGTKAPLFDIKTFDQTYGLELNSNIQEYNITTTSDIQRAQDIRENRTWRTARIQNADDFSAKVAGYMSYFGNIDKLIPKVKLLDTELAANPELFRVGISNSGTPLFTVQRCEFSELGQSMFDTYFSLKEPAEIIGFMKRNITRVMYPFNSPEALREWATVSVPQELEKHAEKLYETVETSMYGNGLNSARLLLLRMKYAYALISMTVKYEANQYSSIRKQWTVQWSSNAVANMQVQKKSAVPKKRVSKKVILPDESANIANLKELIKNTEMEKRASIVEKLFTTEEDRQMILADLETTLETDPTTNEPRNYIYDKAISYNLFASYYNILCDVLTCTMAVRSIWERPNSPLPNCQYIDETPRELIRAHFADYCPKIYQIIQRIINNPNKRHIIYSQYKQVNIPIVRALMALGYDEMVIKDTGGKLEFDPPINPAKKRYMFVTGQGGEDEDYSHNLVSQFLSNSSEGNLEKSLKQHYIDIFNSDFSANDERFKRIHSTMTELRENDICNVVILNSAAAEGITLKKVNFVHLLHPPPDMAKIYQIIGRAIRNCTHASLPESEQTVTAILYLLKLRNGEISSDELKYNKCVNEADKYVPYLNLLKSTAVDCEMNKQITTERGPIYPGLNCVISP